MLGKPYETCKSCETLKQQLEISNMEKRDLMNTILNIVRPQTFESSPVELEHVKPMFTLWSKRRAVLEESEKVKTRIIKDSPNVAKTDDEISKLEQELGVEGESNAG